MQEAEETQVQSLGREGPLEKEMATRSSVLAWRIPWTEESGGLQSMDHKELDMTDQTHTHTYTHTIVTQVEGKFTDATRGIIFASRTSHDN